MSRRAGLPAPFEILGRVGRGRVVGDPAERDRLERAGLLDPGAWERLPLGRGASGRGATARVDAGGLGLRVKAMRRGGLAGRLWRDRHAGTRRLLDNLLVPAEALRRGVATARPVALAAIEGPPGLYRAWLALEDLADVHDLAAALRTANPPGPPALAAAIEAVRRMHDAGIEHRDLNLGNLLVRDRGPAEPEAFVVDLDRGRVWSGSVPTRLRVRALLRLERSSRKLLGDAAGELCRFWFETYAGADRALAARLAAARRRGAWVLALHRAGWRTRGRD